MQQLRPGNEQPIALLQDLFVAACKTASRLSGQHKISPQYRVPDRRDERRTTVSDLITPCYVTAQYSLRDVSSLL